MELHTAQILGSVVAGVCSTVLGHPLDTVKTHLQTQQTQTTQQTQQTQTTQTNPRLATSGRAVVRELGVRGLFRGMTPPLVNAIVMNTVMFSVFDAVLSWSSSSDSPDSDSSDSRIGNPFLAGILSGFATAVISTPTDCLKIRMQLAASSSESFSLASLLGNNTHGTKHKHTISTLYRGFGTNLAREGIFTMVYLGIFHEAMAMAQHNDNILGGNDNDNDGHGHLRRLLLVAATSASTGALAWVASYPFDVAKTMIQSGDSPAKVRALWQARGPRAFFRGCLLSTGRAVLVTSSRMIAYDCVLRWCAVKQQQQQ